MDLTLIRDCEKEIQKKLDGLLELTNALENALVALKKVKELPLDIDQVNVTEYLQGILKTCVQRKELPQQDEKEQKLKPKTDINSELNQGEIKEEKSEATVQKTNPQENGYSLLDNDKFITELMCTSGAKVGVKYKVEVTSPLQVDGTFWASNVETGFVQDKLEPLSEKLRQGTMKDRELWVVDDYSKMVCVKSSQNNLWMRAKVIKDVNQSTVRVQFIDIGRSEECAKSKLSLVPEGFEKIPYMAFHCTLSEDKVKIDYELKWKFSDLVKKKVLNFTVQKLIDRDNEKFALGKLETILDSPPVIINEQILSGCSNSQGRKDQSKPDSIKSRDIRVHEGDQDITSVSAVIRNNSVSSSKEDKITEKPKEEANKSSDEKKTATLPSKESIQDAQQDITPEKCNKDTTEQANPNKEAPSLPPIKIPEKTSSDVDWGESKTPGAEEHFQISPLDDNAFDSPNNSMGEGQLKNALLGKPSTETTNAPTHQNAEQISKLQQQLSDLIQQKDIILQKSPPAERDQAIQGLLLQIFNIQQQIKQESESRGKPVLPPSFLHQPSTFRGHQPSMNNLQPANFTPPQSFNPFGTRSPRPGQFNNQQGIPQQGIPQQGISQQGIPQQGIPQQGVPQQGIPQQGVPQQGVPQQGVPQQGIPQQPVMGNVSNPVLSGNDFNVKIQQLEAIKRCLQMPSGLLDQNQIQNLHVMKQQLEQQFKAENLRQMQMGITQPTALPPNLQPHPTMPPLTSNLPPLPAMQPKSPPLPTNLQPQVTMPSLTSNLSPPPPTIENQPPSNLCSTEFLDEINRETEEFRKQMISPGKSTDSLGGSRHSNAASKEMLNKSMEEVKKTKSFIVPSYQTISTESKADWTARELRNLSNPLLSDPTARFFSTIVSEREGKFFPSLLKTAQNGHFLFIDSDAAIFEREWAKTKGPKFLIVKHKLTDGTWVAGGVLEVISKVKRRSGPLSAQCEVNIISSAMASDTPWFRSEKATREIRSDIAERYIEMVVDKLKNGKSTTLFRFQEKQLQQSAELAQKQSRPNNPPILPQSSSYFSDSITTPKTNKTSQPSMEIDTASRSKNNTNSSQQSSIGATNPSIQLSNPHSLHQADEDWESELSPKPTSPKPDSTNLQPTPSNHLNVDTGSTEYLENSEDESERNMNAEYETFGLSEDDFS